MSALEVAIEELKGLPPDKLAEAVSYLRGLRGTNNPNLAEQLAAWEATGGSLTDEEADAMMRTIRDSCEQIDADQW